MIPTWALFVIVVVLVVGYFLLSNTAKQRRKESIAADFAKMPDFHANQVFTDVRGETAIGIDDRGRRIAVARKTAQPRTRLYSFSHILWAEVIENGAVIAKVAKKAPVSRTPAPVTQTPATAREEGGPDAPATEGTQPEVSSLFGSTARGVGQAPTLRAAPGPLTSLGIRIAIEGESDSGLLIRFYEGKSVGLNSVPADKAFGAARTCLAALDVAIRRAGLPPRPAISGSGALPRF